MKLLTSDYPLALFQKAISSVVGRALTFFATCLSSLSLVAFTVFLVDVLLGEDHGATASDALRFTLHVPIFWFAQAIVGIFQVWGILSYMILAALYLLFVREDRPASHMLPAAFLVQWFEFLRCVFQLSGWKSVGEPGGLVALVLWVLFSTTWIAYLVRHREQKPLLS